MSTMFWRESTVVDDSRIEDEITSRNAPEVPPAVGAEAADGKGDPMVAPAANRPRSPERRPRDELGMPAGMYPRTGRGSSAAARPGRAARRRRDWRFSYARKLWLTDLLVGFTVVFGAQMLWPGTRSHQVLLHSDVTLPGFTYPWLSLALVVLWMLSLTFFDTRDHRIVGGGAEEFKRVATATCAVYGAVAVVAFLLNVGVARGYLLISFPAGVGLLILSRWLWRRWLQRRRRSGELTARSLVVGSEDSVAHVIDELQRRGSFGLHPVGVCIPGGRWAAPEIDGVPVVGDLDDVADTFAQHDADTLVVAKSERISPQMLREISWRLDPELNQLVVVPGLLDVGGPRILARPIEGLPLIHVDPPRLERRALVTKRIFDVVASACALVLLSPLMLVLALVVKATSPGPVFFKQRRVGLEGRPFTMWKFRTMVVDAEERLAALQRERGGPGNDVLFKMKDDPRVTRPGRIMRAFSLDELPQLFNTLGGSMSLVGPRPPLRRELEKYDDSVFRRFLVKPGITGLWQVSGRSNLSWEDSVRLDLYYVENWSFTGDLFLLWRTLRAVVAKDGAY